MSGRSAGRRATRTLLATALIVGAALMGLVPTAAGGCVGPIIGLGSTPPSMPPPDSAAPMTVDRNGEVSVSGRWFFTGCSDTFVTSGCSGNGPGRPTETQSPMTGVRLDLVQGTSTWPLGTADATGDDDIVAWQIQIPDTATSGPATLTAGGAELPIVIAG